MINLITGVPGSGKTYLGVKLLTDNYFFWHKKNREFYRQDKAKKYVIFSNVNGLKLPHKSLDDIFKEHGIGFDQFFSKKYQDKLHEKYPHIIYLLDEVQQYIPGNYKNKDVVLYFDTHRHYGDKIWLITQDRSKITKNISTLCEMEYRAVKSSFSIFGEFRYNVKSGGTIFKTHTFKKDKKIFGIYQSFVGDDQEKVKNPLKWVIAALIIAFLFC